MFWRDRELSNGLWPGVIYHMPSNRTSLASCKDDFFPQYWGGNPCSTTESHPSLKMFFKFSVPKRAGSHDEHCGQDLSGTYDPGRAFLPPCLHCLLSFLQIVNLRIKGWTEDPVAVASFLLTQGFAAGPTLPHGPAVCAAVREGQRFSSHFLCSLTAQEVEKDQKVTTSCFSKIEANWRGLGFTCWTGAVSRM